MMPGQPQNEGSLNAKVLRLQERDFWASWTCEDFHIDRSRGDNDKGGDVSVERSGKEGRESGFKGLDALLIMRKIGCLPNQAKPLNLLRLTQL